MDNLITQTYKTGPLSALRMTANKEKLESEIYRALIYYSMFNRKKKYSYIINETMKSLLCGDYRRENGDDITVYDILVDFPSYKGPNNEKLIMTPQMAMFFKEHYFCRVYALCKVYKGDTTYYTKEFLDFFPCMVGSERCVTGIKPDDIPTLDEWKFSLGEGIPPEYFIRNGLPVSFLHTIRQSTNTIFTTKNKIGIIVTRLTELYKGKTSVLRLVNGKKTSSVKVLCPHIEKRGDKSKHYPLFVVYYILFGEYVKQFDINRLIGLISSFAPGRERSEIIAYLRTSIDKFERIALGAPEKNIGNYIKAKNRKETDTKGYNPDKYTINGVRNLVLDEISRSRSKEDVSDKIADFSLLVCEHVRACIGTRPFDNIDNCKMKKLDDFGRLFEQNINNIIKPKITGKKTQDEKKWSIGRRVSKQEEPNILESLKVDSFPLILSTFNKANVTASERTKSFSIRQVQTTGYGGICPVSTSEGKKCGMVSNIGICTRVSWNSEHIPGILDPIYEIRNNGHFVSKNSGENMFIISWTNRMEKKPLYGSEEFVNFCNNKLEENRLSYRVFISEKDAETNDESLFNVKFEGGEIPLFYNEEFVSMISEEDCKKYSDKIKVYDETRINFIEENSENDNKIITNFGSVSLRIKEKTAKVLNYCFTFVNKYCSTVKYDDYNHLLITNSNIMCMESFPDKMYPVILWFNPTEIVKKIKYFIRNEILPIDTCVYTENGKIHFRYDCGRMMCPFLIVNEDGDLELDLQEDVKNEWIEYTKNILDYSRVDKMIGKLFQKGIMEYVDVKYLENTFIADDISECRRFSNLRKMLNNLDLENCDSYFTSDDKYYYNEDISYVKIGKNKYNIVFTENQSDENQVLCKNKNETVKYAYYKLICKEYFPTDKKIYKLSKPNNGTKRDGKYLCYFDNEFKWIEEPVEIDQSTYQGFSIYEVKFKNVNEKFVYIKQIGQNTFLCETNARLLSKKADYFSEENGELIWHDEIISNGKINDIVQGEKGEETFYEHRQYEWLFPVTKDMDYEHFDINIEKEYFDRLEKLNKPNDRECDFIMTFRRNQHYLDILTENKDLSEIFEYLRENISQFKKRSNIYKIMRYLNYRFKFTHCPIDPNIIYSTVANFAIKSNHNQGPRSTYQCQMKKQCLSITDLMYFTKPSSVKRALKTEQQLVEPVAEEPLYGVSVSSCFNVTVATLTDYDGYEDALVVSDKVYFRYEKPTVIDIVEKDESRGKSSEFVEFPTDEKGNKLTDYKYRHLDENGFPKKYSVIEPGDCICGMTRYNSNTKTKHDMSIYAKVGEEGVVLQVFKVSKEDSTNTRNISIKIVSRRDTILGDKAAALHAQKGTYGKIKYEKNTQGKNLKLPGLYGTGEDFSFLKDVIGEDIVESIRTGKMHFKVVSEDHMPRVASGPNKGMAIDILFSPFSYPSRMTLGFNYQKMATKAGLRIQRKMDGSNFHENEMLIFHEILKSKGLDKHGCELIKHPDGEIITDVTTGRPLRVYICPCSYMKLRHDVKDKLAIRFMGKRDQVTDQPVHGRGDEGGQRVGEMERDAFLSHKSAGVALDRLMYASDVYKAVFCRACGKASSESDITKKICRICKTPNSLVIMTQPRVFRVITQYIETLGIEIKMLDN